MLARSICEHMDRVPGPPEVKHSADLCAWCGVDTSASNIAWKRWQKRGKRMKHHD